VLRYTFQPLPIVPPSGAGPPPTFAQAFFPPAAWALVYWDDHNMVYVRRRPEHGELIERSEYRCLHPEALASAPARALDDPDYRACVGAELVRRMRTAPPSSIAAMWAESLYGGRRSERNR
jgi:hypothetical protein